MADLPSFDAFYAATHKGRKPFPWQSRLAARVAADGWPEEIGVPTGLGKTACLDIAVWALACQAARDPADRTASTRTWYVVNRRLLVDAAYNHALDLQEWLRDTASLRRAWPEAGGDNLAVLRAVGDALQSIAALGSKDASEGDASAEALHITRLRGGAELGARVPDPSRPSLVFSTVPMFASRWLFRGYGSSRNMRSVDAALAGTDSLVLLDEAHLAETLSRLQQPLAQCDVGDPAEAELLPAARARPRFVALTATGGDGDRFDLGTEDLDHPVVQQRVEASKPTELVVSKEKKVPADLASAAVACLTDAPSPTSCLVFTNSPDRARDVLAAADKQLGRAKLTECVDAYLLTGRMRDREAAKVRKDVVDPEQGAPSERPHEQRERHLLIVATQTLEVGADIDVEHLVTETAGARSVVQRFGRLNRLGRFSDATATVVHPVDTTEWPVYGTEPATVWERLRSAGEEAAAASTALDLGPRRISEVVGDPAPLEQHTAELLPHHLEALVKTTSDLGPYETPPESFYDPIERDRRVSVVWRSYFSRWVEEELDPELPDDVTSELPVAEHRVVPAVQGDEAVDIPIGDLQTALRERGIEVVHQLSHDGSSLEEVQSGAIRPGQQIVLPADVGLYGEQGWDPASREQVVDVSALRTGLILDWQAIQAMFVLPGSQPDDGDVDDEASRQRRTLQYAIDQLRDPGDEVDDSELRERRESALGAIADTLPAWEAPAHLTGEEHEARKEWLEGWSEAVRTKNTGCLVQLPDGTFMIEAPKKPEKRQRTEVRSDAFDDLSFVDPSAVDAKSPALEAHLGAVGASAAEIATKLGLPDELRDAVREAGATHDLGKYDPRFQRWLDPGGEADAPLAKSGTPFTERERTRMRAGWPRGGRHELLSARVLEATRSGRDDHLLWDLVIHLVISHHGHGRPDVQVVPDSTPTKFVIDGVDTAGPVEGDLSRPDFRQPARFRRLCETYGYWGLALLEAVVRQADHAASAHSEVA